MSDMEAIKKYKRQYISLIVAAVVLIVLASLLFSYAASEKKKRETVVFEETENFYYGAEAGDTLTLAAFDMQGLTLSAFDVRITGSGYALTGTGAVQIAADAAKEGKIVYRYNNTEAAVYHIAKVTNAVRIATADEFLALADTAGKVHIQTADFMLPAASAAQQIACYEGKYYGNYHTITNSAERTNGIFAETKNAEISGIRFQNIQVKNETAASESRTGGVADYSYNTAWSGVTASGSVALKYAAAAPGYAGGMFGFVDAPERMNDENDDTAAKLKNCRSEIVLTLTANGNLYMGGIAGKMENVSLVACTYAGEKLSVTAAGGYNIYVGGIAGALEKEYENAGYRISSFDDSVQVSAQTKIEVQTQAAGLFTVICTGGLFGYLENHNLTACRFDGEISLISAGEKALLGGIAGAAKKTMPSPSVEMVFLGCGAGGAGETFLTAQTSGAIAVGGLAGETCRVRLENNAETGDIALTSTDASKTAQKGVYVGNVRVS